MPENCKYVGRPTKWGNPFKLTDDGWILCKSKNRTIFDPWIYWSVAGGFVLDDIIELYEMWISGKLIHYDYLPTPPDVEELKGKDLSCFCNLSQPCHVDVLIKLLDV